MMISNQAHIKNKACTSKILADKKTPPGVAVL